MGATGVCNHRGEFTFFFTGYVGSCHDSSAYKSSALFTQKDRYFSRNEYMLGDAAYGLSSTLLTGYRKHGGDRSHDQNTFNALHSSVRVVIEHAFGLLKGRFACLKYLQVDIANEAAVLRA
ncbi:hypothetical protein FBU30_003024, partial [Linnemannia zychae]